MIALVFGDTDRAAEALELAFEERNPMLVLLPRHPIFDGARAAPRLGRLIAGVHLGPSRL